MEKKNLTRCASYARADHTQCPSSVECASPEAEEAVNAYVESVMEYLESLIETATEEANMFGDWEVFNYVTGETIRRFRGESAAKDYCAKVPHTDYEKVGTTSFFLDD